MGSRVAESPWVGVVVSRYNGSITSALLEGAREALHARFPGGQLAVVEAPGAFEVPVLAAALLEREEFDAVVCLACIIKGETTHDRVLADAVTTELASLAVRTGKPVGFGVLTCDSVAQAQVRAGLGGGLDGGFGGEGGGEGGGGFGGAGGGAGGGGGNKGAEAMDAALDVWMQLVRLREARVVVGERFGLEGPGPDKARSAERDAAKESGR